MEAYILLLLVIFNLYHNFKFGNTISKTIASVFLLILILRMIDVEWVYTSSFLIFSFSQLLLFFIFPFSQWTKLQKAAALMLLPIFSLASFFKLMHYPGSSFLLILLLPAIVVNVVWMLGSKQWKDPYLGFSILYSYYSGILILELFI